MKLLPVLLAILLAGATQAAATPAELPNVVQTVTGQVVNLREGPSTKLDVIAKLRKGETVLVSGREGDWFECYVWQGGKRIQGWVFHSLINPLSEETYDTEAAKAAVSRLVSQDGV